MVYTYKEILFTLTNEGNSDIWYNKGITLGEINQIQRHCLPSL